MSASYLFLSDQVEMTATYTYDVIMVVNLLSGAVVREKGNSQLKSHLDTKELV